VVTVSTSSTPDLFTPIDKTDWQALSVTADAELQALISRMSLEEKIGQMLMVGFGGQSLEQSSELRTLIEQYHVGGLVMLEMNAHNPQQISALTTEVQTLAMSSGARVPLFISLNHEGGIVVRISEGVTGFPGNMAVTATGRSENAYLAAALAAEELRAMGVNMNLAPVLDINDNPLNPVIGVRSFGANPLLVAQYGELTVRAFQDNGIAAVAKHFPGHGSVNVDSHGALPVLEKSLEEMWQHELYPFRSAIDAQVAGIMTGHIAVPALDASGLPATLSYPLLTQLLREQMHYEGLIMTDSLGMAGVSAGRGQPQAAVEAVKAGADIVLSTTPMSAHIAIIQALVNSVQNGDIAVEQIDRSVLRILKVKYHFGLMRFPPLEELATVGHTENQEVADRLAFQSVTLLQADSEGVLLEPPPAHLLVISPSSLSPAISKRGTLMGELLSERGYRITEVVLDLNSVESRNAAYAAAHAQIYDGVIFGEWELIKREINWGDQWQANFITYLSELGVPLTVVAWHNPTAILRCPNDITFLTAYGNTDAQVKAVVATLTGKIEPTGELPINLP
jgi:beta-N-acetylhexosaminidase